MLFWFYLDALPVHHGPEEGGGDASGHSPQEHLGFIR